MAKVIQLEEGKKFQMGGGETRRMVSPDTGAELITLNHSIFAPGHEFPQHFHDESDDVFIVLEGGVSVREGDNYTPILAGDFTYAPAGEVHGTVNQTDKGNIMMSFQAPPDSKLYKGERDPSVTGSVPKPPPGHISKLKIDKLMAGEPETGSGVRTWTPVSKAIGAEKMLVSCYELDKGGQASLPGSKKGETVWFVWSGEMTYTVEGKEVPVKKFGAVFVPAGEPQKVTNSGTSPARLIRCLAPPE